MDTNEYKFNFEMLSSKMNLGKLLTEPKQVFGGFLHRMYHLKTSKGEYAVKALNPQIMQRETALNHFIFSEKVANVAKQNGINALPAIVSNGDSVHKVEGQYYMVFPWVYGRTLPTGKVDMECCKKIGEILANVHKIDFSPIVVDIKKEDPNASQVIATDWKYYAEQGNHGSLEWSSLLYDNLNNLYHWEELVSSSAKKLMHNSVISHRDLDQKNVLWDGNHIPILIDWEAAGATNPAQELIDVALHWSGFDTGNLSKEAFCKVISTYRTHKGQTFDNWIDVLNHGFQGKLDWLAYNIRRSLRIECADEAEQELGTSEVIKTLQAINDYADFIPVCLEWLSEMEC